MSVITVSQESFEDEVLRSEVPALVDFWAPWCGPCKALAPIVDEIAAEVSDIKVCKLNVDENEALAKEHKVISIPTIALFKNGKLAKRSVGLVPKNKLLELIENAN
ncbi:MAG: thioredoxin [Clostridiales bacterium]|nr:thioredoxin [Clostridiales bacterium]